MPALDNCTLAIEYVALVAPAMGEPLKFHWYVGSGEPVAAALNDTALPLVTVNETGCVVITGAILTTRGLTVRTATTLVADPAAFDAVTL